MANYYATTRSNYFRVKNKAKFEAWCRKRHLEFWTDTDAKLGLLHAISGDTGDCGGWPSYDHDRDAEFDLTAELARHLYPKDVAVLLEAGAEKRRYVNGCALAVHPDGRVISISLEDIYQRARDTFGPDVRVSEAVY